MADASVEDKATTNANTETTAVEAIAEAKTSEAQTTAGDKPSHVAKPETEEERRERLEKHDDRDKPANYKNINNKSVDSQGYRRNKSNYENLPESDDKTEIRRQVEFYFSDSNLPEDKYLLKLTGGYENKPVDLKVIHNFKRMKHFQPYSAVLGAVQSSKMLDIDEQGGITRKTPLDKKFGMDVGENKTLLYDETIGRSIYAKGFGPEYDHTQLDVEKFFKPYGPVKAVRLRRFEQGQFKGSVFIEFETSDLSKQFLELEEKPSWTYKDKEGEEKSVQLEIRSKQDYVEEKNKGIRDGTVKPGQTYGEKFSKRDNKKHNGRRGGKFSGGDDWKGRRNHDQRNDRRGGGRGRYDSNGGRGRRDRDRDTDDAPAEQSKKRSLDDSNAAADDGAAKKQKTETAAES